MNLNNINSQALRNFLGTMNFTDVTFAIDANPENVQTGAAAIFAVNGVFTTVAATAEIDLSALLPIDAYGTLGSAGAHGTIATGYDAYMVLVANSGTIRVLMGAHAATGAAKWPRGPDGYAAFAGLLIANASGSDFEVGVTSLATAGVTDTYYDLACIPAN